MLVFFLVWLAVCFRSTIASPAADWRSRSIYQVFTDRFARTDGSTSASCNTADNAYCGGTWTGIRNKLDYIKNMGFTAIWISPVTAQVDNGYHGYYQTDLYSLNNHFGSADDLRSLISAAHSRKMLVMLDVVPNHMGWRGCHDQVNYKNLATFNDASHYHNYCPLDNFFNQTETEVCWLGDTCTITTPDLKTEDPYVSGQLNQWIKSMVSNYTFDGLRIDSVKNVNKDFFPGFCSSAGVFCMGEVSNGYYNYSYPYQKYMDSVLDFPMYYSINRTFTRQSGMSDLVSNLASCTDGGADSCKDPTLVGRFIENHDNPRFAHYTQDMSLVKNAIAFTMLSDGIPVVYQGQEQHFSGGSDPACREALWSSGYNTNAPLYKHITTINQARNQVIAADGSYLTYQSRVLNYTSDIIQLRKSQVRVVLTNQGQGGGNYVLNTNNMGFKSGESVVEVLGCSRYTANSKGDIALKMQGGQSSVLVPASVLRGSRLCGT